MNLFALCRFVQECVPCDVFVFCKHNCVAERFFEVILFKKFHTLVEVYVKVVSCFESVVCEVADVLFFCD